MKLRNKKTGKVFDAWSFYDDRETINLKYFTDDGQVNLEYKSLAELNEGWEDYKPKEPIIKDLKVRKAVRAWAEANGTSELTFDGCYILTDEQYNDIEFGATKPFEGLEKDRCYTIEELCGEEEKCES